MLHIDTTQLVNATYAVTSNPSETFTCIGYGQHPTTGVNYVVGVKYDSVNNRNSYPTHLLKDVVFIPSKSPNKV